MLNSSGDGKGIGEEDGESWVFEFNSDKLLNLNGRGIGSMLIFAAYVWVESPSSSSLSYTVSTVSSIC